MQWIRCFLLVLVVLRLLTGAAWAMPSSLAASIAEEMPCHAMESGMEMDDAANANATTPHAPHNSNILCHVCCMGVLHTLIALNVPAALPRHAPPVHHAQDVARWQHTPDLRPPI